MATLAGGVLAAYIAMLGGDDPQLRLEFAKHLLTASVMAAPGAVIFSKMIVPPTEDINQNIEITKDKIGSNVLDAITNGTTEGVRLAVNVAGMLLAFIAFIAMFNFIAAKIGAWTGLNELIVSGTRSTRACNTSLYGSALPNLWVNGVCSHEFCW
jgi:CNT family concentrative nucleoside transporter